MRHACPPCPPDRTKLPHYVGRRASGRRKVRAQHRRIARPAAILARSCWIDQEVETCPEAETCPDESVSARLTDLASRDPASFPSSRPVFFAVRSILRSTGVPHCRSRCAERTVLPCQTPTVMAVAEGRGAGLDLRRPNDATVISRHAGPAIGAGSAANDAAQQPS
jgi:hypothetical protein